MSICGHTIHCVSNSSLVFWGGSSVLRGSAWFISRLVSKVSVPEILSWMGDMSKFYSPSKCAARFGLSLTTTQVVSEVLDPDEYYVIDDIVQSKHNFTDGCGMISPDFVRAIAKRMGDSERSCYQIRFMGCKGTVIEYPLPKGKKLALRKSMVKHETDASPLEVAGKSARRPAFTNREIILLLSALGVPNEVFFELQEQFLEQLMDMVEDPARAIEFLRSGATGGDRGWHSTICRALESGFSIQEPFLLDSLCHIRDLHITGLRRKTRIRIQDAALLYGVADPSGKLSEGQVCIRLGPMILEERDNQQREHLTILGPVYITRNPCLHCGDVRVLEAVMPPLELAHLRDVVVFSTHGIRSPADEMAGGDYDGDMFHVCWEQALLPPRVAEPMMFDTGEELKLDRPVTIHDIRRFFVDYLTNAGLGQICTTHKCWADLKGVDCSECVELAKLASVAVDYPKTGKKAVLPKTLRTSHFPDYMTQTRRNRRSGEVGDKKSNHILSLLYAEVRDLRLTAPQAIDLDPRLAIAGHESYLDDAWVQYESYAHELFGLMRHYDIRSEAEIFSGSILEQWKFRSEKDLGRRIAEQMTWIKNRYRAQFFGSNDLSALEQTRKASAWYMVTVRVSSQRKAQTSSDESDIPMAFSFPWIVGDVLIILKGDLERRRQR